MNVDLAARIIRQANTYRRLTLTLSEFRELCEYVKPNTTVIIDEQPVYLHRLHVDVLAGFPIEADDINEDQRTLVASFAEGLLDAEDVHRLWPRPT